jgi:hypothetical protein
MSAPLHIKKIGTLARDMEFQNKDDTQSNELISSEAHPTAQE